MRAPGGPVKIADRVSTLGAALLLALAIPASAQPEFLNLLDHLSLAAPDQPKAVAWYQKHFGGQPMTEGPDRLMYGQTRLVIQKSETAKPSMGTAFDHIGFSVADIDAALKDLAADGAKVTSPARDIPGL